MGDQYRGRRFVARHCRLPGRALEDVEAVVMSAKEPGK